MAGAGVRLFTAGSVLTASQVNTYLMDQVVTRFADSAARDAAFGGLGEPVLSEGRICYQDSDNKLYIYNGSAWVEVALSVSGASGQLIIYDGSGTPTAVTMTGDVTITNAGVTSIASGAVVNADISSTAAIALSKLASGTAGQLVVHNATGVPTATTVTGDVTITSGGVTTIGSGVIVDADINASAAIAHTKLANATAGQVLLGSAGGAITATTVSGDVTINSSGVTTIGTGVIVDADINASAAIAKTKISGTAITASDTGTVTSTMIADGTIVDADINASAAIAKTKISGTAITAADTGTVTSTMIADGTIVNADINAGAAIAYGKLSLNNSITPNDLATGPAQAGFRSVINAQTGTTYTLATSDLGKLIELSNVANITFTVPTDATATFNVGDRIDLLQTNSGQVTVTSAGGVVVNGNPGLKLRAQWSAATLIKRAANTWVLVGDLSA